jgi:hypothetical protein
LQRHARTHDASSGSSQQYKRRRTTLPVATDQEDTQQPLLTDSPCSADNTAFWETILPQGSPSNTQVSLATILDGLSGGTPTTEQSTISIFHALQQTGITPQDTTALPSAAPLPPLDESGFPLDLSRENVLADPFSYGMVPSQSDLWLPAGLMTPSYDMLFQTEINQPAWDSLMLGKRRFAMLASGLTFLFRRAG